MTDLKPCPFCGGKPISYGYGDGGRITVCCSCGCNLTCSMEENVVKKWNTRHYPPEVEKAVERMKPKKPERRLDGWNCPICEMFQTHEWEVDQPPFCWNCGQRLKWSEE